MPISEDLKEAKKTLEKARTILTEAKKRADETTALEIEYILDTLITPAEVELLHLIRTIQEEEKAFQIKETYLKWVKEV